MGDANSLDADNLSFIRSLSVNTSFSDRELDSLGFMKSTLLSHTTFIGAEISIGQSILQHLETKIGEPEVSIVYGELPFCLSSKPSSHATQAFGQLPHSLLTNHELGLLLHCLTCSPNFVGTGENGQLPYSLPFKENGELPYCLNCIQRPLVTT